MSSVDDLKSFLLQTVQNIGSTLKQKNLVDQYIDDINAIAVSVEKTFGDGFQWSDTLDLVKIAKPLIALAAKVGTDLSGEEKRQFVVDAMWVTYKTYDKGVSGNENNIDIPVVFGALEDKTEEVFVRLIAEFVVHGVYNALNENAEKIDEVGTDDGDLLEEVDNVSVTDETSAIDVSELSGDVGSDDND